MGCKIIPFSPPSRETLRTKRGTVEFIPRAAGQFLAELTMDQALNNFRSAKAQHRALLQIAGLPEGRVSIARSGTTIIGYVTFHRPHRFSRWAHHPLLLEVGGIEVSPAWRKMGIASRLLKVAFSEPDLENYITFTTEYCWHWDLERSGLDIWRYQKLMIRLFESVGLVKMETDDPDILAHPANVFMARIGKNVPAGQVKSFQKLLFKHP
ncbi:MAG: GNAT family N-acetyltransferase [Armatimonadetes bacterium]|nr:GNAT family N-acetyltransferase [Armatimonadota bacterium]